MFTTHVAREWPFHPLLTLHMHKHTNGLTVQLHRAHIFSKHQPPQRYHTPRALQYSNLCHPFKQAHTEGLHPFLSACRWHMGRSTRSKRMATTTKSECQTSPGSPLCPKQTMLASTRVCRCQQPGGGGWPFQPLECCHPAACSNFRVRAVAPGCGVGAGGAGQQDGRNVKERALGCGGMGGLRDLEPSPRYPRGTQHPDLDTAQLTSTPTGRPGGRH